MFSKLVIIILLAVTLWFYLKIVMLDQPATVVSTLPQASVQVVEGPGTPGSPAALKTLPNDQMRLIEQVFAPELSDK